MLASYPAAVLREQNPDTTSRARSCGLRICQTSSSYGRAYVHAVLYPSSGVVAAYIPSTCLEHIGEKCSFPIWPEKETLVAFRHFAARRCPRRRLVCSDPLSLSGDTG